MTTNGQGAPIHPLDGTWHLAIDPQNIGKAQSWFSRGPVDVAREAVVPGIIQRTFPGFSGVAWFWKDFDTPVLSSAERLRIHFHAADYFAEAWLNGEYLGSHEGGETPFSFDATKQAKRTGNNLVVRIINPGSERIDGLVLAETPHGIKNAAMQVGNFWNPGGLWQSVELRRVPAVRIDDLFVLTRRDDGLVTAKMRLVNETGKPIQGVAHLAVAAANSGPVLAESMQPLTLVAGESEVVLELHVPDARPWSFDDPFLYRATASVEAAGLRHEKSLRTGFRELVFRDGYFRLNGKRFFLKGAHSVGHFLIGQHVPTDPEMLRRELIAVKAMGLNTVRWLGRTMFPSQLDLCDELGLMVYQESYASWNLGDSPQLGARFDQAVRDMVLRDRSHPCVVMWGLLNETPDGPTFRHATGMLPMIRENDPSRMVMLGSGRFDGQWSIGSLSNPGSAVWEPVLGLEAPNGPNLTGADAFRGPNGGYRQGAGDLHQYLPRPWSSDTLRFFRTVGEVGKNVFLSEHGNGCQLDPIAITDWMDAQGASPDLEDYKLWSAQRRQLERDWKAWKLDDVFASAAEMFAASQRLQTEQRRIAHRAIRSNPKIAGYSITGLSDEAEEGEGLLDYWRNPKPGVADVIRAGSAPLQWCLFVGAPHVYTGAPVEIEAVLVNEDALKPGDYPVRLRVVGPAGVAFEKRSTMTIPAGSSEAPFVVPAFLEKVALGSAPGEYVAEVSFERGASAVARESILVGDKVTLPKIEATLAQLVPLPTLPLSQPLNELLGFHGVKLDPAAPVILSQTADAPLLDRVRAGAIAILLELPALPDGVAGKIVDSAPLYWGRDDIVRQHPIFNGLPSRQIMDLAFYRDLIASRSILEFAADAENIMPAFAVGKPNSPGYWAGSNLLLAPLGRGKIIVSTLRLLDNVGRHPAADRIVLNLVAFAQTLAAR